MISVMGEKADAVLRFGLVGFGLLKHPENFRENTVPAICHFHLRPVSYVSVHRRDDCQDVHTWNIKGKVIFFIEKARLILRILSIGECFEILCL